MGAHRITAGVAVGVLVVGLTTACDGGGGGNDGPDPQDAADALASALASGDLGDLEFTDETADAVTESGGTATATLAWSWPVGAQEWSYTSEVTLKKVDDEWQVLWQPSVVEP